MIHNDEKPEGKIHLPIKPGSHADLERRYWGQWETAGMVNGAYLQMIPQVHALLASLPRLRAIDMQRADGGKNAIVRQRKWEDAIDRVYPLLATMFDADPDVLSITLKGERDVGELTITRQGIERLVDHRPATEFFNARADHIRSDRDPTDDPQDQERADLMAQLVRFVF